MAQQNNDGNRGGNGKGTSKVHDPEKDLADRKAAQARKAARKGSSKGLHNETYYAGSFKDRINQESVTLLDRLMPVMVSSSPTAAEVLRDVLLNFVENYASVKQDDLRSLGLYRNQYALNEATKHITDKHLLTYIQRVINNACSRLRAELREQRETSLAG